MKNMFSKIDKEVLKKEAKKYALFAIGGALIIILLFVVIRDIVGDTERERESATAIFMDVPDADTQYLHTDMRRAYEAEDMLVDVMSRRTQSLDELFPVIDVVPSRYAPISTLPEEQPIPTVRRQNNVQSGFLGEVSNVNQAPTQWTTPEPAPVVAQNEPTIDHDEIIRQRQEEARQRALDDFDMMMQRHMQQQGGGMHQEPPPLPTTQEQQNRFSEENVVMPVTEQGDGIVSSLRRGGGFHGTGEMAPRRNTILATVSGRQVVSEGQNARIRLREPMQVGRMIIPIGSIIVGTINIGVDRVFITISSIEHNGVITPVRLTAFDYDGQHGLFVPGSLENETLREIGGEIASAIGTGATTSVSMINNQSAMEQIQGEVMRGAIQGTARYVGRRITQVRVVLQDNHRLFLVAQN